MRAKPATIVFAFSDTGCGHRSAALAIQAAIHATNTTTSMITCEMLDILRLSNVPIMRDAPTLYDLLSTQWLDFYNLCYRLTDSPWRMTLLTNITLLAAKHPIQQSLGAYNPHIVVCTHPLVTRFVCAVRQTAPMPFRIVTVVTDLVSLHGAWVFHGVDHYVLPTTEAYQVLRQQGIAAERIHYTGFPVHPKFAACGYTKQAARRKLTIDEGRWTVLITGGGVGSGQLMHDLVIALEAAFPHIQMLVVTGKNHTRYTELLAHRQSPTTHIYGFVADMDLLMAASDVVITKAGPGTLMEALVMQRPVIITEAVGMQEQGNIDFVLNHDIGFYCPTLERIKHTLDMLQHPPRYAALVDRLHGAMPTDGATQIAHMIREMCTTATTDTNEGKPG